MRTLNAGRTLNEVGLTSCIRTIRHGVSPPHPPHESAIAIDIGTKDGSEFTFQASPLDDCCLCGSLDLSNPVISPVDAAE
jgi:hypothetical protein